MPLASRALASKGARHELEYGPLQHPQISELGAFEDAAEGFADGLARDSVAPQASEALKWEATLGT
jgi:hypothetical protein